MTRSLFVVLLAMSFVAPALTLSAARAEDAPKTAEEIRITNCKEYQRQQWFADKELKLMTGVVGSPANANSLDLPALKSQLTEAQRDSDQVYANLAKYNCL